MKREKLSDNFYRDEFACKCGCGGDWINESLVNNLQAIREAIGRPIYVTSGVRCLEWNKKISGHPQSKHKYGRAVDIYVLGIKPEVLMDVIQCVVKDFCGIGVYQTQRGEGGFVHFDVLRAKDKRWTT